MRPWISAEGLVWAGGRSPSLTGDVLVLTLHVREPHGYAEARAGRFVLATGAVHPVQIDGAHVIARAPWGAMVETFGGLPVVPRFGARSYDWLAGGRVARASRERRGAGRVLRAATRVRGDLERRGRRRRGGGSGAVVRPRRVRRVRHHQPRHRRGSRVGGGALERLAVRALRIAASRPAGCCPRRRCSRCWATWRRRRSGRRCDGARPRRLDLLASGAGQDVAGGPGGNGWVRATLELDDRGKGNLGVELRRVDVPGTQWTGVRAIAAVPSAKAFATRRRSRLSRPTTPTDEAWRGRGASRRSRGGPLDGWEVAGALEASATPAAPLRGRCPAAPLVRASAARPEPAAPPGPSREPDEDPSHARSCSCRSRSRRAPACSAFVMISPSHPFEHRAHVLKGINCVECHADVALRRRHGTAALSDRRRLPAMSREAPRRSAVHGCATANPTCARRRSSRARAFASSTRAT